ncbi:MAG TPA: DUF4442 domain-containing protein [Limnobacter sp.]|nr:DUF4442 domain-containing protein [Limnobacter sp.]
MNIPTLASHLASQPFFRFAKLSTHAQDGQTHTLLGFDPFLKNHIGTLHAGALFTAAQADAQACLQLALEQHPGVRMAGFSSQIVYKRPAKGPVWMRSTIHTLRPEQGEATTSTIIHNQNNEPLAELTLRYALEKEGA